MASSTSATPDPTNGGLTGRAWAQNVLSTSTSTILNGGVPTGTTNANPHTPTPVLHSDGGGKYR